MSSMLGGMTIGGVIGAGIIMLSELRSIVSGDINTYLFFLEEGAIVGSVTGIVLSPLSAWAVAKKGLKRAFSYLLIGTLAVSLPFALVLGTEFMLFSWIIGITGYLCAWIILTFE